MVGADYGECARPVEFPEGNPIQRGELEHFQTLQLLQKNSTS